MVHALPAAAAQAWLRSNTTPKFRAYRRRVEFTASGTWTCPAGVSNVLLFLVGGGGSGGNAAATNAQYAGAQGGFGGSVITSVLAVTPGSNYAVTIGQGGVASSNSVSPGVSGGDTIFANVVASGGQGGGAGSQSNTMSQTLEGVSGGGAGGAPSSSSQVVPGSYGAQGVDGFGGGGGGGASYSNNYLYAPMLGTHGGGMGATGVNVAQSGASPTGGGGGGGCPHATYWRGGNGASGYVLLEFDQLVQV